MSAFLAYLRARLGALRAPRSRELAGGALVAALIGLAWCAGQRSGPVDVQEVRVTRYDTVTVERIAKQEPQAKPSVVTRVLYHDVQPERVQVAPGAGAELLAAVCDTMPQQSLQADGDSKTSAPNLTKPPALVYAWKVRDGWLPLSRVRVELFAVGQAGESVTEYRVRLPAEGRQVPAVVVREARFPVRRVVWLAGAVAAGWIAHSVATQF